MSQQWNAVSYANSARFVSDLAEPLVALLAPRSGEHILDLGCGDGFLSAQIQASGAVVVGIDASSEMVAAACARGIDARVMPGEAIEFTRAFDAVFSNAALHWMSDLKPVFAGVAMALKPGGRFVAEMGGEGNVVAVVAALKDALGRRHLSVPSPWIFPSPEAAGALLSECGFGIDALELIDRPTRIPGELPDWLETFAGDYLERVPVGERANVIQDVQAALQPVLHSPAGWTLDYVRLRFSGRVPRNGVDGVDGEVGPWLP